MDHEMSEHNGTNIVSINNELSRQVTVASSSEQYERLFFQPSVLVVAILRSDSLTTSSANPTLLDLIGFLVPYTSTILILCGFRGAVAPQSLVGLSGDYYFFGCIAMNLAGIAEFILGNSIISNGCFLIYGSHWGSLAYTQDPIDNNTAPFAELGGANGAAYDSSQGFHNVSILVMMFSFIAAADFSVPTATTATDIAHIEKLLKIGGGFSSLGLISGWYLATLTTCEAVEIPCPLCVFDLSSKVFPSKERSPTGS
ncbi:hypothetical protein CC86DRAFT_392260 [Ophiobolus disseminans]|uniref:GPR1/FUN34/YaaH-class plasma membrane protein-like protein n=1 Tax=Ophiobolus disseminans TaxID=1469910 RepID=A0A6A7A893_9PLEO|nr:hypothetical protein CC86DRAFT_392260 [Ophiobolus disseminans]